MWNIIDDPVFGKSDQYVIYLLLAQSGSGGNQPFINIYIIGKQSGIRTEDALDHLVCLSILVQILVKFVAGGGEYQAGSIVLFFRIFYITGQLQYFQRMMSLQM